MRQVLIGGLSSLGVAYVYCIILLLAWGENVGSAAFGLFPFWAVFVTSWYVVPVGAIIGLILHTYFRGRGLMVAALAGAGIGLVSGCVVALFTVLWEWSPTLLTSRATIADQQAMWGIVGRRLWFYAATMAPLCALWVAPWAWLLNWKLEQIQSRLGRHSGLPRQNG